MPLLRALSWLASAILKASENCSFDMRLNGEHDVLVRLSKVHDFRVIFDVGANHGDWTQLAIREFPDATFHCFEIAPPVFSILSSKVPKSEKITLNAFGLADREDRVQIRFAKEDDGLTSLLTPLGDGAPESVIPADLRTGDGYLASKGLREVDFLKVDVEGAEPLVFAGFKDAFGSRRIRCIQFEYGHSGMSLREYYRFFEEHGYRVGKIFPDGCDFGGYVARREQVASNYIAVRAEESTILKALTVYNA
jgi:FkbM family methyltransferase